jgi:hypothetical protein
MLTGLQKIFCRLKCPRGQSGRSQQAFQCYAHRLIIIDNGDYLIVSVIGHGKERSAVRKSAQLYVGIGSLNFQFEQFLTLKYIDQLLTLKALANWSPGFALKPWGIKVACAL